MCSTIFGNVKGKKHIHIKVAFLCKLCVYQNILLHHGHTYKTEMTLS